MIAFLLVFGRGYTSGSFFEQRGGTQSAQRKGLATVSIRDLKVNAKIAERASDRKKGLSGQDSLPLSQGLLFVFDSSGLYPFWMKDMKFAIDIIWISEDKRVVYIARNAAPEPDRDDDELTLYRPDSATKYVLEINAGLSARYGIEVGDIVNFEL